MKISYCWDLTDLNNNLWYGIVLRNIPFDNINDVESYFIKAEKCKGILYCISVKNINDEFCAILIMEDINEADRMCYKYNKFNIHGKKIKVKFFSLNFFIIIFICFLLHFAFAFLNIFIYRYINIQSAQNL